MDGDGDSVLVLIPDNGRDDFQLTIDLDGVQCGVVRTVPSVELDNERCVADYTGVLQADELPTGTGHVPFFYFGHLYDQ